MIPLAADPVPGTVAIWELFAAKFANPVLPAIIYKDSEGHHVSGASHGGVAIIDSPDALSVMLMGGDTDALLGNYVWTATLVDPAGNVTTASSGTLTVTLSAASIAHLATIPAPPPYDATPFQTWMMPLVYKGIGCPVYSGWQIWRPPGGPPFGYPP
jgi:hypothetical protein